MAPVSLTEVGETGGHRTLPAETSRVRWPPRLVRSRLPSRMGRAIAFYLPKQVGRGGLPIRLASSERDEAGRHRVPFPEGSRA